MSTCMHAQPGRAATCRPQAGFRPHDAQVQHVGGHGNVGIGDHADVQAMEVRLAPGAALYALLHSWQWLLASCSLVVRKCEHITGSEPIAIFRQKTSQT